MLERIARDEGGKKRRGNDESIVKEEGSCDSTRVPIELPDVTQGGFPFMIFLSICSFFNLSYLSLDQLLGRD